MGEQTALHAALKEKGYRLTAARQVILQVLISCEGHVTADELVVLVHEQSPGVGRMTVYRTLELLSELGLIRPVYQGTGAAHYVLMHGGHHHHLVCSVCHRVIEFDDCVLGEIEQLICNRYQFEVQSHLLELYGRCPSCQKLSGN
jgi:Fur family ferric uptake transcriptional regulator